MSTALASTGEVSVLDRIEDPTKEDFCNDRVDATALFIESNAWRSSMWYLGGWPPLSTRWQIGRVSSLVNLRVMIETLSRHMSSQVGHCT
jgi:hypothetical protein